MPDDDKAKPGANKLSCMVAGANGVAAAGSSLARSARVTCMVMIESYSTWDHFY